MRNLVSLFSALAVTPRVAASAGWQDPYACYLRPRGMAACGSPTCHSASADLDARAPKLIWESAANRASAIAAGRSSFICTSQDLANIRAWIQNGAQNN